MASIKALHIEIGARVSGFVRKMRKIRRDLRRMRRDAKRMASSFVQMGKRAAVGAGLIGAGMVAATKRFATFEANLLRVQALTNGTEKDFNSLKATAERMGITTAFTASEAAEAMVKLAQQGRTTSQTMFMLPKVLDLAVVGTLELDEAARLAGVTLNQFGLGVEEVERAADVLAKGASISATTVEELGQAMTFAGPLARNMGFSLEETVAVLAAFANVGVVSGRAGRAFAAVIAELGTEIREQGLIGALDQLGRSGKTADQLMTELNRIAGRSVGSLARVTSEILNFNDELVAAAGTSKNFAEKVLSKTEGAFVRLRSAADGLINSLGETFAPFIVGAFEEITNSLKTAVEFMKDFRHEMGFTEEAGAAMAQSMLAGVAGLLDASAQIMKNANAAINTGKLLLVPFQVVIAHFGVIIGGVLDAAAFLGRMIEGLGKLFGSDVGGNAAARAELEADAFFQMADDAIASISKTFSDVADGTGNATTDFIENLGNNFERIREKFEAFKPPEAPDDPSASGTPDLGGGLVVDPPTQTLFNQFPDVHEELMKIPASLAQVSKEFDGFLAQDLIQNLLNAEISIKNLDELVSKLENVDSAVRKGFLEEQVGNAIAESLLKEAGAFTAIEVDPPDFTELQSFVGEMSASLSERDLISEFAGFKVGSKEDRAIFDSKTLTNSVVDQFVRLFEQLDLARQEGRLAPGEFEQFNEAIKRDLLATATGDLEDPTQGFTESLQTALGAVKVDPFAETSQKRTMKASEETAKATQEIAKNTKGLGSILT